MIYVIVVILTLYISLYAQQVNCKDRKCKAQTLSRAEDLKLQG